VVEDTRRRGENDNTKTTSGEEQVDPRLDLGVLDIETRRDDAAFIQSSVELDDYFTRTVVVDDFEFTNVAC
jgi:hypothetical protein